MGRNLVVCCDGTGNDLGGHPTNVLRLAKIAERDDATKQMVFYDTGVGTILDPQMLSWHRKLIRKAFDQATGLSLRDNFLSAYSFLIDTWQPGDRIMLFGFSRGAYTARMIASAIRMFGIPRPESRNLARYIWQALTEDGKGEESGFRIAAGVRKHFARDATVDFLGVWDTVSAFGMITAMKTVPYTRSNDIVEVVRHAVALDERRSLFASNRFETDPNEIKNRDVVEIGFPGVHSDVGGGYHEEKESQLAMIAFEWMLQEAQQHGLLVNESRLQRVREQTSKPSADGVMHNSLRGFWNVIEFLPVRRWNHGKGRLAWHWPNFFRARKLSGLKEHPSVEERRRAVAGYKPTKPR